MDQPTSDSSIYQELVEKGLVLPEKEFQIIFNEVTKGIQDASSYLDAGHELQPKFIISDAVGVIGFSVKLNAIHLPINYLNLVSGNTTPIEYRDQLVCFVPDKFYIILKYVYWLRIFARESAIHYFQKIGNPKLKVKFPDIFETNLSPRSLLLTDLEVEARIVGGAIMAANQENSLWKNVDSYFAANFPDYYNKPIGIVTKMPRPSLEISFELESIL